MGGRLGGPGGAGDVEMDEGRFLGPELHEARAGAGAAFAKTGVFRRGDFGEDVFLVFVVDRQGPDEFAGGFSGGDERIAQF